MNRYYYTDPLAAAWMLARQGMKFASESGADAGITSEGFTEFTKGGDSWLLLDKLYIHPDSLHLLEPQVGDLVMKYDKYPDKVTSVDSQALCDEYHQGKKSTWCGSDRVSGELKIIQRNGKAFHWPEVEDGK